MANATLSYENLVDSATLSASSTAGDLAIGNVSNPIVGRRWRTTSLTAWGQADFGGNQSVDQVALVFPRDTTFPTGGTIQHQFDADGGTPGTGAAHDSGAVAIGTVAGYGYHVYVPSSQVTARYWRFTFNVSGVSFIDVGRAWAGTVFQPTYDVGFGYADEWRDLSLVSASVRSGSEFVDSRARQRVVSFGLNGLSDAERQTLRELQRIAGISSQVLFVRNPDSSTLGKEAVLGRFAETTPLLAPHVDIFSKAFTLIESL